MICQHTALDVVLIFSPPRGFEYRYFLKFLNRSKKFQQFDRLNSVWADCALWGKAESHFLNPTCGVYPLVCTLALNFARSNSSRVCEQRLFHTAYFHYIVISLLPLLCGGKIRVPFPSLVFNHRPRRGPMLTQQLEYGAVQQSITSKWALLDIWQHSGSYTQLPPVLLSLSAPRLNTEKSYSFIFFFFHGGCSQFQSPIFKTLSVVRCSSIGRC